MALATLARVAIVYFWRRLSPAETSLRRLRYGYVVDFIDHHASWRGTEVHWPTFNVADMVICAGGVLLCVGGALRKRRATFPASPGSP